MVTVNVLSQLVEMDLKTAKGKDRLRILHVDDDPSILEISKQILMDMDGSFDIDHACCVDEAFKKLSTEHYDVVISDYEMPQKNGLQFLEELRAGKSKIPFVLFTGKGREEVTIKALNLGADGYINKQGAPETVYGELAHSISSAGDRKRVDEELEQKREIIENVAENIGADLTIIDKDYRIVWANRMLKDIGGVQGKLCYSTYNNLGHVCPDCGVKKVFEEGAASDVHEYSTLDTKGEYVCVNLIVNPIKDSNGACSSHYRTQKSRGKSGKRAAGTGQNCRFFANHYFL